MLPINRHLVMRDTDKRTDDALFTSETPKTIHQDKGFYRCIIAQLVVWKSFRISGKNTIVFLTLEKWFPKEIMKVKYSSIRHVRLRGIYDNPPHTTLSRRSLGFSYLYHHAFLSGTYDIHPAYTIFAICDIDSDPLRLIVLYILSGIYENFNFLTLAQTNTFRGL